MRSRPKSRASARRAVETWKQIRAQPELILRSRMEMEYPRSGFSDPGLAPRRQITRLHSKGTERGWGCALSSPYGCRFSSFIFLHTNLVCPVLESITVLPGRQLQVTVLAFSCFVTMQCSMTSLFAGGSWLRTSGGVAATAGGVAATGCFFAAQPLKNKQRTRQPFFILIVFALCCHLVD